MRRGPPQRLRAGRTPAPHGGATPCRQPAGRRIAAARIVQVRQRPGPGNRPLPAWVRLGGSSIYSAQDSPRARTCFGPAGAVQNRPKPAAYCRLPGASWGIRAVPAGASKGVGVRDGRPRAVPRPGVRGGMPASAGGENVPCRPPRAAGAVFPGPAPGPGQEKMPVFRPAGGQGGEIADRGGRIGGRRALAPGPGAALRRVRGSERNIPRPAEVPGALPRREGFRPRTVPRPGPRGPPAGTAEGQESAGPGEELRIPKSPRCRRGPGRRCPDGFPVGAVALDGLDAKIGKLPVGLTRTNGRNA